MNLLNIKSGTENVTEIINDFLQKLDRSKPTRIEFERDTYYFKKSGSKKMFCYNSGGQNGYNNVIFPLDDITDITIEGNGSEFVFCARVQPFSVNRCKNVTLSGFSTDFSFLRYAFAEVISMNDEGYEVAFDEKIFSYDVKDGAILFGCGEEMLPSNLRKISTKRILPTKGGVCFTYVGDFNGTYNSAAPNVLVNAEKTEKGVFLRYKENTPARPDFFSVGARLCLAYDNDREMQAFHFEHTSGITMKNVTIYRQGGMGFVADVCNDITLDHFRIGLKEGREEYFSTTADGIFLTNCGGYFTVKNCSIENCYDDAMNVHGYYTTVKKVISKTEAELQFIHFEHWGILPYFDKDRLYVSTKGEFNQIGKIDVEKVIYGEDRKTVRIIHSGEVELEEGMLLENQGRMPIVTIENSTFRDCPHIRLSAPEFYLRGNEFDLLANDLYVSDLIDFWGEGGAVRYGLIENNSFGGNGSYNIAITSCRPISANRLHEKIEIKNNRFKKPQNLAISYEKIHDLVLECNEFGV